MNMHNRDEETGKGVCVVCGAEGEIVHGMCIKCFDERVPCVFFPQQVDITVCAHCGAIMVGKRWVWDVDIGAVVSELIRKKMRVEKGVKVLAFRSKLNEESIARMSADVAVDVKINGFILHRHGHVVVNVHRTTCKVCSRKFGNYYEAIIQIRGEGRVPDSDEIQNISNTIRREVVKASERDRGVFITKEEDVRGGKDFYLSSSLLAKKIAEGLAKKFSARLKVSPKLVGRRDGREVYRVTYSVRLPRIRAGDIIENNGEYFVVEAVARRRVKLKGLRNPQTIIKDISTLARARVVNNLENAVDAVVVYRKNNGIYILDPETYETTEIFCTYQKARRNRGVKEQMEVHEISSKNKVTPMKGERECVKVIKIEDSWFLVE